MIIIKKRKYKYIKGLYYKIFSLRNLVLRLSSSVSMVLLHMLMLARVPMKGLSSYQYRPSISTHCDPGAAPAMFPPSHLGKQVIYL